MFAQQYYTRILEITKGKSGHNISKRGKAAYNIARDNYKDNLYIVSNGSQGISWLYAMIGPYIFNTDVSKALL